MKLDVLGCAGGEGAGHRATAFLINKNILVDAGSVVTELSLQHQAELRYTLISHAHLDHIKDLGFIIDNTFAMREWPLRLFAEAPVIKALKEHFFNWTIWPDFTALNNDQGAVLQMFDVAGPIELDGLVIETIEVNHPGRAFGFVITDTSSGGSIVITGDTGETEDIWLRARELADLKAVFVDTAFPDHMADLARVSGHLTPSGLIRKLEKYGLQDEMVYCYHLKPAFHDEVLADILAIERSNIVALRQGQHLAWV